jgi:hypothetical protein
MVDSNDLPPKVYRKLLSSNYQQNRKDAKSLKENWTRNGNPILQKESRYFSPRTRGNILTQEYIKKMAEKPEKAHIKRIPIESNFGSGPTVIKESKPMKGIRLNPKIRKNESSLSAPKIEIGRKPKNDNYYKYFYLDNFNSVKQNQNDIDIKNKVSKYIIIKIIINIEKISK